MNYVTINLQNIVNAFFDYLYVVYKSKSDGDPTRILLSDKMMQINIVLWISVCIAVIYFRF